MAFEMGVRIPPSQDNFTLQQHFLVLFERSSRRTPSDIAVILSDLGPTPRPSFSDPDIPHEAERVTDAIDQLNLRFGLHTVYPASIHDVRNQAPTRVPFGPPPPLEEFDDPADNLRPGRKSTRKAEGFREPYEKPRRA